MENEIVMAFMLRKHPEPFRSVDRDHRTDIVLCRLAVDQMRLRQEMTNMSIKRLLESREFLFAITSAIIGI